MRNPDVIVVGAGPVGLAAAIGARIAGLRVVVVDPRPGPVDKACGEGLMPGALAELERLGVDPRGHSITGITYRSGGHVAAHEFAKAPGRGVRRTELSRALHERAAVLDVAFVEARVASLVQDARGVRVALGDGTSIRGRWLLGCDGLHSTVRRLAGLELPAARPATRVGALADGREVRAGGAAGDREVRASGAAGRGGAGRRYGLRRHYRVAPWSSRVEVFWGEGFELYVTPVDDELVGVALLGPRGLELESAIEAIPELAARLRGVEPDGAVAGAGALRQRVVAHSAGRVLLVGDASGYVDALTGEGMRVGFAQAAAAVKVITRHVENDGRGVRGVRPGSDARQAGAGPVGAGPVGAGPDVPQRTGAEQAAAGVARPMWAYERAWRRASGTANRFTMALLIASRSPLRRAIVPVAARVPAVFAAAVEVIAR